MTKNLPHYQSEDYPFAPHYHTTKDNLQQHYLDEGEGFPTVMLHGNPTWSFLFRNLVTECSKHGIRSIVPDHIGCGLSEKPQKWFYTLENHIQNLEHLIDHELKLEKFDLIIHDWGGAIGMGYATRHPEKIRKIIIMNTAAFTSQDCPRRIAICRWPIIGSLLMRGVNTFVEMALRMAPATTLSPEAKRGFRFPYQNWHDRVAVHGFVLDIPLKKTHVSRKTLQDIEDKLPLLASKNIYICWGMKDFCFHESFLRKWQKFYPNAKTDELENVGHYLLEDAPQIIFPKIIDFLTQKS